MKIRTKLLLPVFIIIFFSVFLFIYYIQISVKKDILNEIDLHLQLTVTLSAKFINKWIEERCTDFKIWSNQQVLIEALTETGYYGQSAITGASKLLTDIANGYYYYDYIFIADTSGNVVSESHSSSYKGRSVIKVADRKYFQTAMQGEIAVSKILKSRKTDRMIFVISAPVYKETKIVGAITGSIAVSAIKALFADDDYSNSNEFTFICEKNGSIFTDIGQKEELNQAILDKKLLEQKKGILFFELNDQKKIAGFKKIIKTDWFLFEVHDLDKIFSFLQKIQWYIIAVTTFLLVLITVIISMTFEKIVTIPTKNILKVIGLVNKGNLKVKAHVNHKSDEMGILISEFNNMINQLDKTHESLNSEIKKCKTKNKNLRI